MRLLSPLCAPDCSYWLVRRSVGHMFTLVFVSCHALGTTLANTRLTTTMAGLWSLSDQQSIAYPRNWIYGTFFCFDTKRAYDVA